MKQDTWPSQGHTQKYRRKLTSIIFGQVDGLPAAFNSDIFEGSLRLGDLSIVFVLD